MTNYERCELLRKRNINLIQEVVDLRKQLKEAKKQSETSNRIAQTQLGLW